MDKYCELCDREVEVLTEHHLVPKCKGGLKGDKINVCLQCKDQIHALHDPKTLARELNTLPKLKSDAKIHKYIVWARKQKRESIKTKRSWK